MVFFLTSKQSQHKIVIDTLRMIKEKNKDKVSFSVVDVISKQAMCPRDIAQEYYALFNDLCTHDQKTNRCRYFRSNKNITKHILENIMHVEELKDFCARNLICPHKTAIDAISKANIIICDYNYLFTDILETVLEKTHKSIGDLILIIDEAHNLPDRLRDHLSGELTLNLIEEAAKEINPVDKKIYLHLKNVDRFFDNFIQRMPENTEKNINREDITTGVEQVLQESLGDNISYLEFVGALKDAGVELAEKKQYEEKKKSSITSVMEFFENWNTMFPCSRVYKNNITPTLSFRLLDPSVLSESIISNAHATILMSGTLYPVEMYADILGAKHSLLKQYDSPFPSENKIVLVTKKLTTLYTERSDLMYSNIAEKISKIHDAVKGNIAVFFPSYSLMDEIYKKFESHPDFEIQNKTNDIILEKKYMSKSAKDELYLKLKINSNKILMGVQAGSLSEGVDYRSNIIHAVLIVGLPLSPPTLEVKNLQDYYIKKFGKEKGTLYGYIYPAISKVIQAAGRGIRNENDVGAIILMDYRFNYPMYRKCLPPDYKIQFTDEPEKDCREFFGKDLVLKALECTKKRFIEEEHLKQIKEEKRILAKSETETEKQQIQETIPERAEEKTENNDNYGLNILGLVETMDFLAGRSLLASILTGSKSKELINRNINKSEYYGMMKGYTREEVINIIDQIIDKGYLGVKQSETTNFPRPLLY
ncbi:MAG: helicase C-terminal domain-containing protein [Candidatus Altarchaeum sp.]|nr:helicase C-terminal domain-containing protein [Candidatus Altarchaeum sp.]